MRRISLAAVVVSAAVTVTIFGGLPPGPSARASIGAPIFFSVCSLSHRSSDDPIVHPHEPGDAHAHDFTGAWSTDAFSSLLTLRASGTTCDMPGDTAAYWTPTLYDSAGTPVEGRSFAYFMGQGKIRRSIKPYPPGLKQVADMSAHPASGWHCGDAKPQSLGGTLSKTLIPICPDSVKTLLQAKVVFADCWDGKRLDSPDHRSHMAYASLSTHRCPRSHPVPVPLLNLKTKYQSFGGPGLTISSGGPETFHADFFNSWDQNKLARLVRFCINGTGFDHKPPCRGLGTRTDNPRFPHPTTPAITPPSVIRFTATAQRFAVGRRGAGLVPRLARRRGGTRFGFVLTEPGRVTIRIDRVVRGNRARRYRRAGFLASRRLVTRGSLRFSGRLRKKALPSGRYRATITATDAARNQGRPRTLRLRIVP